MRQSKRDVSTEHKEKVHQHNIHDRLIIVVLVLSGAFLAFVFLIGFNQESFLHDQTETTIEHNFDDQQHPNSSKSVVSNVSNKVNSNENNQIESMSDPGHIGYLLLTLGIVILGLCYLIKKPNDIK